MPAVCRAYKRYFTFKVGKIICIERPGKGEVRGTEETINLVSREKKKVGGFSKFCFLVVVFTDFLMILVFLLIFLGKGSNLTNYTNNFSNGWFNHQLDIIFDFI